MLHDFFDLGRRRLQEIRLENEMRMLRADMTRHAGTLNSNMQNEFRLLRAEVQLEQQENASQSDMAQIAQSVRRPLLNSIEEADNCSSNVYRTVDDAFSNRRSRSGTAERMTMGDVALAVGASAVFVGRTAYRAWRDSR